MERRKLKEKDFGYGVDSKNVWEVLEILVDTFGADDILDSLARALGTEDLGDNLAYICRNYEFYPFGDDEDWEDD